MPNKQAKRSLLSRFFRWNGILIFLFFAYIAFNLIYGTLTDYQPEEKISLDIVGEQAPKEVADSSLTLLSWNIGYGGLGAKSNFFYHGSGFFSSGGRMVRSPKPLVEEYNQGIVSTLKSNPADFYLIQEVDVASKRSYFVDQQSKIQQTLGNFSSTFAPNYQVQRVPTPLLEPWNIYGQAYGGLGTFSRFQPAAAERLQLPGEAVWPNRLFLLDRCLAVHRYPTAWGKELVVINLHNSAFDRDGSIKSVQMAYLKKLLLDEYQKGHYLIVGGDWNQCPPGFKFNAFHPNLPDVSHAPNVEADFMPPGWLWAYDPAVPTNRRNATKYRRGETFTTIIDYFLVSPNVEIRKVKGIDEQFAASDHQPVYLEVKLR